MDNEEKEIILDESFIMYSLLYSAVTVVFGIAVLVKFFTSELRLGLRSLLTLVILFIGEPVCQFVIRGHLGFVSFALGCLFLYLTLPASHLDGTGKSVLITGCDSGFGHALAKRLHGIGMKVYAGCLNSDGSGACILQSTCSSSLQIIQMDITDEKQIKAAVKLLEGELEEGLWGLVNNAGIWYCAEADMMPISLYKELFNVNFIGTMSVTKAFLPLIQKAQGRIVFLSSIVGKIPLPQFSAYSASKAAIESFADCLRLEMKKWKVIVSTVQPNGFYTDAVARRTEVFNRVWDQMPKSTQNQYGRDYFDAIVKKYNSLVSRFPTDLSPVLRCIKSALLSRRPRTHYPTDKTIEVLMWLYGVLPSWLGSLLIQKVDMLTPNMKPQILNEVW